MARGGFTQLPTNHAISLICIDFSAQSEQIAFSIVSEKRNSISVEGIRQIKTPGIPCDRKFAGSALVLIVGAEQQAGVAIGVKPVTRCNGAGIGRLHRLQAAESADQHEQR